MLNSWKKNSIPSILAQYTEKAWINPITGKKPIIKCSRQIIRYKDKDGKIISKNANIDSLTNDLRYYTKDVGRYHISYKSKNMNLGDIITAERLSTGELVIFDPQVGDKLVWDYLKKRIDISYGIKLYRVDNLYVNLNLVKGIVLKD